ncbi:hypothetical protein INR49_032601 [Caranx melampygus]|nr:hypothetical protein INR49_032601 [Caranx melampygus]
MAPPAANYMDEICFCKTSQVLALCDHVHLNRSRAGITVQLVPIIKRSGSLQDYGLAETGEKSLFLCQDHGWAETHDEAMKYLSD